MSELFPQKKKSSKIDKHDLTNTAVHLLTVRPKMSNREIAESLNSLKNLTGEEAITAQNVLDFSKSRPDVRREILLASRKEMRKLVMETAEFDMLSILKDMVARLKFLIDTYEQISIDEGSIPNPKEYKALSSELRETLKQIEGIHKEVYDMEIVRAFLQEVLSTLKEVNPEALGLFIERMKGKRQNSTIVSELLKGGLK